MPGEVTFLSHQKATGWAIHPVLNHYRVLVHVIFRTYIVKSVVADQPSPPNEMIHTGCWFNFNLSDLGLPNEDSAGALSFMIGETDEYLKLPQTVRQLKSDRMEPTVMVEDMIFASARRNWITGGTYIAAEEAGLEDRDIIDLLYRDILGRPGDPGGLANYLFQRKQGIRGFDDIRKSLLESEEYMRRSKRASEAPGAVFSQNIVILAASAMRDDDSEQGPSIPPEKLPEMPDKIVKPVLQKDREANATPGDWPNYPALNVEVGASSTFLSGSDMTDVRVDLQLDSVLFGTGWYKIETNQRKQRDFRWMQAAGNIFSPKPSLPCVSIILHVAAVYGAHMPMVDCYLDDTAAETSIEKQEAGFIVCITPAGGYPVVFTKLRIESRKSGCPLQEERGSDARVLSLNVVGVTITYRVLTESDVTGQFHLSHSG